MKVGDLVSHRYCPCCIGTVLSFDEFGTITIRWLTTDTPTRKGVISKHKNSALKLLSEA